jgi:hypothetical protein
MAKARKKVAKKLPARKKSAPARKKKALAALTDEQRLVKLKPPPEYPELCEKVVEVWQANRGLLRVANRTAAGLRSHLKKAMRASDKEQRFLEKMQVKLTALADDRIRAEHDVWETTLDVYAVAKAQSRTAPEILRAFEFLAAHFASPTRKPDPQ